MRAIILSAGLGTRLKPLTNKKPKALVEVSGKPVIDHILWNLFQHGISEVIVNTHHKAKQIQEYLSNRVLYQYEPVLLGTAGSVKISAPWLASGDPDGVFLVVNGDTLSNADYTNLIEMHKSQNNTISELRDKKTDKNAGVYIIDFKATSAFPFIGMLDETISLIAENFNDELKIQIPTKLYQGDLNWFDIGTFDNLKKARQYYEKNNKLEA